MDEDRYGPNTPAVEALVDNVKILSRDEAQAIRAACIAHVTANRDEWEPIRLATMFAGTRSGRTPAQRRARADVKDAVERYSRLPVWWGMAELAEAIVVRDLLPVDHIEWLSIPWRSVMGELPGNGLEG